jgi:hypothetical protein
LGFDPLLPDGLGCPLVPGAPLGDPLVPVVPPVDFPLGGFDGSDPGLGLGVGLGFVPMGAGDPDLPVEDPLGVVDDGEEPIEPLLVPPPGGVAPAEPPPADCASADPVNAKGTTNVAVCNTLNR